MKAKTPKSVTRLDFLQAFVECSGMDYTTAVKVYGAMVGVFETAIVNGDRIGIGQVMSITPEIRPAREVNSNFRGQSTTFHLGARIKYKVRLFRKWLNAANLNWTI